MDTLTVVPVENGELDALHLLHLLEGGACGKRHRCHRDLMHNAQRSRNLHTLTRLKSVTRTREREREREIAGGDRGLQRAKERQREGGRAWERGQEGAREPDSVYFCVRKTVSEDVTSEIFKCCPLSV